MLSFLGLRDDELYTSSGLGLVERAARAEALKEALICEVHAAALLTATLTSTLNVLTDPAVKAGHEVLRSLTPGNCESISVLARLTGDVDGTFAEPIFLFEYIEGLAAGRARLETYHADAHDLGSERAAVLHKLVLADTWRQISHLAALAIKELDVAIAPDLPEIYVQNARVLQSLLAGARNGWRPPTNENGEIVLPPLPQQRRWPRRALLQPCTVIHRGTVHSAFARDISAGGMGLANLPATDRAEPLTIELQSGRVLKGLVAWSSGGSAGVRFHTQLSPSDPLLIV